MIKRFCLFCSISLITGLAIGYGVFVRRIDNYGSQASLQLASAQGLVVLTGADDRRIQSGLTLLKNKKGSRLLISGVHAKTRAQDLMAHTGEDSAIFLCCVDLGYEAQNTWGNAYEVALWAEKYKYKKLILITSDYHMPRAHMIFHAVMPEHTFILHATRPVDSPYRLFGTPLSVKFIREYMKFLLTIISIKLDHSKI